MNLSKKLISALIALIMAMTMVLPASAAEKNVPGSPAELANRVVGYFPSYRTSAIDQIDYSALTHIVLSFITYNNGTFSFPFSDSDIQRIRTHCDENGVKLMLALGGWDGFVYSNNPIDTAAERTVLVDQIMGLVDKYNLDGVDIDTEITDGVYWSNFDAFISQLSGELKPDGKLLTMAVSQWFTDPIANSTYDYFDFVNLMSYDYSNSDVAPMSQVTAMLEYYSARGITDDRMTIGVPFYGYDANHRAYTFSEIIGMSTDANNADFYNGISYNGEATIRTKAEMSKNYGGIMIWELGQDSFGEYSLLADIKDVMSEGGNISASLPAVTNLTVTDSTTSTVSVSWTASAGATKYQVYCGGELLGTTGATSYNALNLKADTSYTIKVVAVNDAGEVSKGASVGAKTSAGAAGDYVIWDAETAYSGGAEVIHNGKIYRAKWYTKNEEPGSSDWVPWDYVGEASDMVEEKIYIGTNDVVLSVGETTTIDVSVVPAASYTWSNSDSSVASISGNVITGLKEGTTTLTATSAGGKTATCTVTVGAKSDVTDPEPEPSYIYSVIKIGTANFYDNLNGVRTLETQPIIENGKAYIALRNATELLYAYIKNYNDDTGEFDVVFDNYTVKMQVDRLTYDIYNKAGDYFSTEPMDAAPILKNGKVYLPAREIAASASMDGLRQVKYTSNSNGEYVAFVIGSQVNDSQVAEMISTAASYIG